MHKNFGHYFNRKKTKLIVAVAIVLLVIYPFLFSTKKSFADEISLFPTKCEGSWNNVEEATGDPADNLLIGAESVAVGDTISCYSFDASSLPEDATITNTQLELVWTVVDDKESFVKPSIEESYDQVAPVIEEEIIDQNINIETLDTEITPLIEESEPQTLPKTNNIESNSNETKETSEPTSSLPFSIRSFFISEVLAEEQTDPVMENSEVSNETTADIQTEQTVVSETKEKDLPTEEIITSEEKSSESIVPENNTVSDDGSEQIETNSEIIVDTPKETSEVVETGTALYNIFYSTSDKKQQSLGQVTQEQLSRTYPLAVTIDDLPFFKVSLTSLMTFDQIDNLALEGIKLVVEYSSGESLDPIRQPNLRVDKVLDRISFEGFEAIRIERADNEQYEIWYRKLSQDDQLSFNNEQIKDELPVAIDQVINNSSEVNTFEINSNPTSNESDSTISKTITQDLLEIPTQSISNTALFKSSENTQTSSSNLQNITDTKKTNLNQDQNTSGGWSYVVGDMLINKKAPIDFRDGIIFWLNKEGTALYTFAILNQSIFSQSYNLENNEDFIMYKNPSNQEKKAIFDFLNQKFIFPD